MKKFFLIFVCMIFAFACGTKTDSSKGTFEGTIEIKETTYNNSYNPETTYTKMTFLGSNVRGEDTEEASSEIFIVNIDKKNMITLDPVEKQYTTLDFQKMLDFFKELKELADVDDQATNSDKPKTNITKTGKSVTLHGFKCEEYVYSDDEITSTALVCENFSSFWTIFSEFTSLFGEDATDSKNWLLSIIGASDFPFKIIEETKDGELISEWEIVKVDKSKPNSSLFEIPKDYKEVKDDMFGG